MAIILYALSTAAAGSDDKHCRTKTPSKETLVALVQELEGLLVSDNSDMSPKALNITARTP